MVSSFTQNSDFKLCLVTGFKCSFYVLVDAENLYEIAWAFLRPFHSDISVNFNKRLKLQLYSYQKLTKRMKLNENIPVYNQWNLKRKKYPAIIEVTVKEVNSTFQNSSTDNVLNEMNNLASTLNIRADIDNLMLLSRNFQVPQSLTLKKRSKKKGCLLAKFSPCGKYLAYTEVTENEHNIYVLSVPEMEMCHILRGHSGLIHDLEWFDRYILTASADHSVILWSIDDRLGTLLKIMPHSSYVYCSKVIEGSDKCLYVVTGGRDGVIRIWRCSERKQSAELLQEIEEHKDYVTTMTSSLKTGTILSADAKGLIIEWKFDKRRLKRDRLLEISQFKGKIICDMMLNTTGCKVFIQVDGLWEIYVLGLPSGILIQKIDVKNKPASVHQKLSISGCGTFLFCPDGTRLLIYDLYKDEVHSDIRVPFAKSSKTFISSSTSSMRLSSLAVTVYGLGGGLVVYTPEKNVEESKKSLERVIKESPVSLKLNSNSEFGSHLKQIIQRIDQVFLTQQLKGRESDGDAVHGSSGFVFAEEPNEELEESVEEEEHIDEEPDIVQETRPIPLKRKSLINLSSNGKAPVQDLEKGGSSGRSGTFIIENPQVERNKNEINDRTFSISINKEKSGQNINKLNTGTFSIDQPKEKKKSKPRSRGKEEAEIEDDTTISESLH